MKTIKSGAKLENDANNDFKKEKKGHYLQIGRAHV